MQLGTDLVKSDSSRHPLDYNNEIVRFHDFCFMTVMSIPIM